MNVSFAGRPLLAVLLLTIAAGCATRAKLQLAADQARADALVREGCYDCLLDARAAYERLPGSRAQTVKLMEVDLLLALRAKELSLDPTGHLNAARQGMTLLAPAPAVSAVLDIVSSVPEDATGRRVLPPSPGGREALDSAIARIDTSPFSALFKSYLRLAMRCGRVALDTPSSVPQEPEAPLLTYRLAICENPIQVPPLEAVRQVVPRAVETSVFRGRAAMADIAGSDGRRQRELFEEAYARFSDSPAIAFNLATVYQATGDCRRAEELFSRTLTLRAEHEAARLGRAICRTYLSRNDEAISDTTVLIDAVSSNRAEAYYWRAWNHRRKGQLDMARADIEGARALLYNARVLTLAGMIEHDQKDFDKAREDLTRARDMDNRECQARWYLGLVGYGTERWSESAGGFADSADCYASLVAETERARAAMAAREGIDEAYRKTQIAGFDAAIAEDSTQKSAADLNAAINYARAGDVPNATLYMKRAAIDPERRVAVEDLRQVLGVPRW
jgi:tetratricopeptide (TPR) repeat protein